MRLEGKGSKARALGKRARAVSRRDFVRCGGRAPNERDVGALDPRRTARSSRIVAAVVATLVVVIAVSSVLGAASGGFSVGPASLVDSALSVVTPTTLAKDAVEARDVIVRRALSDAGIAGELGSGAPAWFEEEVLPSAGLSDLMATDDWSVVGYSSELTPEEEMSKLCDLLAARGWSGYESGVVGAATFGKDEGACRWMLVSCVDSGATTSVVLQVQR